ncbi:FRG domain-containing protein [Pseudoalteromonas sp. NEC-BIFX-2020_015]|uniref:FRG domain-containing protein n=1 Tax=Pseudoalteromonas sp. NEC-BIFX-2020_015 TaxID=2729544 RepID=UPI0014615454|nr:FRG domain-containing protein [Pseudoalteromonas sp. NEC-BIFX-2020_015]NMR27991.1 FRG domain-containing protein [Pseudoalteromonas sp. NEC-BIFX-2020_015]
MKEIEVDGTLSAITASLNDVAAEFQSIWFRGQPNYEHKLVPGIFRQGPAFGVSFNEQLMFEEFKRRYPDQSSSHKTTYEWLTLMQHYGLPTRLLDWSSNLLVSLYFCCMNDDEKDGALFIYDPTIMERNYKFTEFLEMQVLDKTRNEFYDRIIYRLDYLHGGNCQLNDISLQELKDDKFKRHLMAGKHSVFNSLKMINPMNSDKYENGEFIHTYETELKRNFSNIVPFKAPHLNPRIRQQHGYFTFHGGMFIEGKEFIPVGEMEDSMYTGDTLIKIKISKEDKKKLLKELLYSGISESTLFPEMEYQAKEIKSLYTSKLML